MSQKDLTEQLPAELLTMVFQAWKNLCGTKRHGLAAEWVRATWVCETWREIALEAAALWCSILVSRRLADDPTLKTHLDRAHGIALDLSIFSGELSKGDLEEAFSFVLSRTKSVTQLQVTYGRDQQTVVKGFVKAVGVEVVLVSLALSDFSYNKNCEWEFTPDILPRLRYLTLERIVPIPSAPLLTLVWLDMRCAYDDLELRAQPLALGKHFSTRVYSDGEMIFTILPRNVSEALSPIRHTRCLSLTVGQAPPRHLVLRGSSKDTFQDDSHAGWSVTIPDLTCTFEAGMVTHYFPDQELAELFYLGFNGEWFLTHIPNIVIPSQLVELELHFAQGLPVARNLSRFFATMPHLRTLGIGGCALVEEVLKALPAHPCPCSKLQNLTLCAATGPVTEELHLLQFFRNVLGSWVRKRTRAETKLPSLTVRIPMNAVVSHASDVAEDNVDGGLPEPDVAPVAFGSKLRRDLAWLEDLVGTVVVENVDCPACAMEYDLPPNPDESTDDEDAEGNDDSEDSDEPYFY